MAAILNHPTSADLQAVREVQALLGSIVAGLDVEA